MGFVICGLGFGVQSAGCRVQGAGFRVQGLGFEGVGFTRSRMCRQRCPPGESSQVSGDAETPLIVTIRKSLKR